MANRFDFNKTHKAMKKLLCYFFSILTTGCVTIRSNVTKDTIPKFTNILVVLEMKKASDDAANDYLSAFPEKYNYSICAIAYDELSFESLQDKIQKQAEICKSEAILLVKTTNLGTFNHYGAYTSSTPTTFYAEMSLLSDKKPFWKAQIQSGYREGGINPKSIINRLIEDGVISK